MTANKNVAQQTAILAKLKTLLKSYPNVLADHPELFEIITLNEKRVDNVMSLSNRQVDVLKAQIEDHNKAILRFVNNAKHNEFITSKLFDITYELTACRELGDVFDVLYQDLVAAFSIDSVGIKLALDIPSQKELSEVDRSLNKNPHYLEIFNSISNGKSICGSHFSMEALTLFFDANAEKTASAAFAPLIMPNSTDSIGIIGLSSTEKNKFSNKSSYGTLHLDRLGKIIAIAIERVAQKEIQVLV